MNRTTILFFIAVFGFTAAHAQTDTITFKNGDIIVGEIKSMDKGVIQIETDYSDSDFKIEWLKVQKVRSDVIFLISTSNGHRYSGKINSLDDESVLVISHDTIDHTLKKKEIVYLKSLDSGFWSQLYASVDIGFNYTKANNLTQLSVRSNLGYFAEKWSADLSYNEVNSTQDDVDPTNRTEGVAAFRYLLPKDWYSLASVSFLSNTEQKLDLRTTGKLGMGKYIVHTNRKYWGFNAGASFNNEKFSNEETANNSLEAFMGTELNLYDIGDLSLLTSATAYRSITESDRWRGEFKFDAKYDLPLDFYIKAGFSLNYDNRPAEDASETDYVIQTSFGWEL
jgi:putative salt-induced outer membrane protein YdiY